jgi:uncharacterized membrane protein YraQ (UPF0718 family)
MTPILDYTFELLVQTLEQVLVTFQHNWVYLIVSILIAALLKKYVDASQVSTFLMRYRRAGTIAATAAAVGTPLCSCGTTAVLLGMMASQMPWAPIVAFMVASPLTSPQELVYSAGLFGWPFALAFFLASILLGLAGGLSASLLENRGLLAGQVRFAGQAGPGGRDVPILRPVESSPRRKDSSHSFPRRLESAHSVAEPVACSSCATTAVTVLSAEACCPTTIPLAAIPVLQGPQTERIASISAALHPAVELLAEMWRTGKRLVPIFFAFAFVGYFLNALIPSAWVTALFGSGRAYSVPLAATLGLPFYLNTEASLPLVRGLLQAGMSQGAALAFMISGAGTSLGALGGALTIARWRVVGLVVGTLWVGAILFGFGYDLLLGLGFFW